MRLAPGSVLTLALAAVLSLLTAPAFAQPHREVPAGFELVYDSESSGGESMGDSFTFSDEAAWRHDAGGHELELFEQSDYRPPHHSPRNIALLDRWLFDRFVLEVEVQQTGPEYDHRDACFFYGFESPARFYYVHLATTPDDRAHNNFLVDGADRTKTTPINDAGVDWGDQQWHTVRVERGVRASGLLEVYFDDAATPTVTSNDTTLGWGRVGVGSFDDTARFRRLRVWAPETREAENDAFD